MTLIGRIAKLLSQAGVAMTTGEIAEALGEDSNDCSRALAKMKSRNQVLISIGGSRPAYGRRCVGRPQ